MAHELHIIKGKAQMAYIGEKPWHSLGTELKKGDPLHKWITAGGFDWEAEMQELFRFSNDGSLISIGNKVALVHSKTGDTLGIVSPEFKIVQPATIIHSYAKLVGAAGYQLETIGNLFGGKRIWALADVGEEFTIMGQDKIKRKLLLATAFDGGMSSIADYTSWRVVCNNTFSGAVGANGDGAKVKVPHSAEWDIKEIAKQLKDPEQDKHWKQFKSNALQLAERKVTAKEATQFFLHLFYGDEVDVEAVENGRKLKQVAELYTSGVGQDVRSAKGTAWGLVNAITRWADHERQARSVDGRLESAWFGSGEQLKAKAMEQAMKLAA